MGDDRGVSSVLGIALILGLTVTMVTALFVVGAFALSTAQTNSELSQMENSMSQLSSKASLVALGEAGSHEFNMGDIGSNQMTVDPNAGMMHIYKDDPETGTEVYHTESLGVLRYENNGQTIGYQAGGVWRAGSDDGGWMISPPEFHYRDETLTLPVIRLTGADVASRSISGTFSNESITTTMFPTEDLTNPVDDTTVFVEIQSEYHQGWKQYLETRSDGEISHDPSSQTVTMELTVVFEESFESAIAVQDSYDGHHNANVNQSDINERATYPSVTDSVTAKIGTCDPDSCESITDSSQTFNHTNTYYADGDVTFSDGTVIFETGGENADVEMIIDGKFTLENVDIEVEGDGRAEIYVTDEPDLGNSVLNANENTGADQFHMYVHSGVSTWTLTGSSYINGIVYAPGTDVTLSGNAEVDGAIIARNLDVQDAANSVSFDHTLTEAEFGFDATYDGIRFLHITENVIHAEFGS